MSDYYNVNVCNDCYFAHHNGSTEHDGLWYSGESDTPCDREPLALVNVGKEITDNTDVNEGDGIIEFTWTPCEGCGSTLGGSRHRLAVWEA